MIRREKHAVRVAYGTRKLIATGARYLVQAFSTTRKRRYAMKGLVVIVSSQVGSPEPAPVYQNVE
jgi:hypothetical protein